VKTLFRLASAGAAIATLVHATALFVSAFAAIAYPPDFGGSVLRPRHSCVPTEAQRTS
jgi:hypothetical protein